MAPVALVCWAVAVGGVMARGGRPAIPPSAAGAPSWWDNLVLNDRGGAKPILMNGDTALCQDPAFVGAIRFDAFRGQTMLCAPVPWDGLPGGRRPWVDQDDYMATLWLQDWRIYLNINAVHEVVEGIAKRNSFHPVKDFLKSLYWDGGPRLGDDNTQSWLTYYLGVEDSLHARKIGRKWLLSAIARIDDPGCKADSMLVLVGPQGLGKSTALEVIGGQWYTNDIAALGTKDSKEQLIGAWLIELAELDAIRRVDDVSAVKSFLSMRADRFRFSYGRRVQSYQRQCVFAGSTNSAEFLRDATGNRRFWCVTCTSVDIAALRRDRDQLLAEAYYVKTKLVESHYLDDEQDAQRAEAEAEKHFETDPWAEMVLNRYNQNDISKSCRKNEIGQDVFIGYELNEIFESLGVPVEYRDRAKATRLGMVLRKLGFIKRQVRVGNNRFWRYWPPGTSPDST